MRRLLVLLLLFASCRAEPQIREPSPQVGEVTPRIREPAPSIGSQPAIAAEPSAPASPKYRTDASGYNVDPKLAGSGKTSMVASEDRYASQVGKEILAAGGNAVDAAVATAFALAVTHPSAGNIAGGGFAIVRTAKRRTTALDFRETAPAAATPTMFLDASGNPTKESVNGHKACGVPGSVAGLWALHQKYGKVKWASLIAPAIKLAQDGFSVDEILHKALVRVGKTRPTTAAPLWWPEGKAREVGEVVKNPELAVVLERIAAKGPDGFYGGETAAALIAEMKRGGGIITAEDLANYKVVWRQPLKVRYRNHELHTMPPPSSGGVVLAITANILRKQDLRAMGWHSAKHVHWLVEAWRRGYAARNEVLGDPAFVADMPVAKLVSQDYADKLAATITDRATPSKDVAPLAEAANTTNITVVDKKGMAVAMTTTLNTSFGNLVMVSGFLLNNEMDDFTVKPGAPNAYGLVQGAVNKIAPGKRMLSSMSPTIIEDRNGDIAMVISGQGGARIITEVWQTLSNVLDFGMPVADAIAAPRVHHQHLPDEVVADDEAMTKEVETQLKAAGHSFVWNKPDRIFGSVEAIVRTRNGWDGAADPRKGGAALGN